MILSIFFLIRDFLAYALQRTVLSSWSSFWEITLGAWMALSTRASLSQLEEWMETGAQQALKTLSMVDVKANWSLSGQREWGKTLSIQNSYSILLAFMLVSDCGWARQSLLGNYCFKLNFRTGACFGIFSCSTMELMEHWKLLLPRILGLISPVTCSDIPPSHFSFCHSVILSFQARAWQMAPVEILITTILILCKYGFCFIFVFMWGLTSVEFHFCLFQQSFLNVRLTN